MMHRSLVPLLFAYAAITCGCESGSDPSKKGITDAGASPNASILPAPLVTDPLELFDASASDAAILGIPADSAGRLILPEAGPPVPEPLVPGSPIPVESPSSRDVSGVSLEALFRFRDLPGPPKAAEVANEGIEKAQKLTALSCKIDLSEPGRMRMELSSRALPLPPRSEIRARSDRYGNLVLWPDASAYRVIPPGALRTLLGERRVDVTPLSVGTRKPAGEGKRLGVPSRKLELSSSLGTLRLELGKLSEVGEGGALLCRALVEIAGIDPRSPACKAGEVPLSAAFSWQEGGGIDFEVGSLTKRSDLSTNSLLTPPPGASFEPTNLPQVPYGIFLSKDELAALRSTPLPLGPSTDPAAPGEGFVAQNHTDALMYLLIDGIAVVAVPPASERYVIGPVRGRYNVQWRTFLGEKIEPPKIVEMPARLVYGTSPDAGVADGG